MRVTKYKHACILIEEAGTRLLIDPTSMASGWQNLTNLNAVFITHEHSDHLDPDGVAALATTNPNLAIYANDTASRTLQQAGIKPVTLRNRDQVTIDGVSVEALGSEHAPIHGSLPKMGNTGIIIAGRLLHPGDSFVNPNRPIEILATPTSGPWIKTGEAIDYLLSIHPQIAFPIHEALDAIPEMTFNQLERAATRNGIKWTLIPEHQSHEF